MEESQQWSPCQFDPDGLVGIPAIHDHFVYGMVVNLDQHWLVLHTEYRDGSGPYILIDLRFVGVVAHHFDHVSGPSILLDIGRDTPAGIIDQWAETFDRLKNHGWPSVTYVDRADLAETLASRDIQGYRVMGSCRLDGFVLAIGFEYRQRLKAADLDLV